MAQINFPILSITKPTNGDPVFNAQIFVGDPDTDPTVPANQRQVSARQESGTVVPISQPIRTNAAGLPVNQGSPVILEVAGNFSMTIQDSTGVQLYHFPSLGSGSGSGGTSALSTLWTDSGTANAYVLSPVAGSSPTQYVDGMVVMFKGANPNTSTAVTIQLPGLPAVQADVNLPNTIRPDRFVKYRYNATTDEFERELFEPTNRGWDAGQVIAQEDGDSSIGRRLLFHYNAGQAGSSANFGMTSPNTFNAEGLNAQTFEVGGVELAEMYDVLSAADDSVSLVAEQVYAGSSLRGVSFYIPAAGGAVTAPAPTIAFNGSYLCKATVPAQAGQLATALFVRIAG